MFCCLEKNSNITYAIKVVFTFSITLFLMALLMKSTSYAKNVPGTEGICNICKATWETSAPEATNVPSTYDYVYYGELDETKKYDHPNVSNSSAPTANCPQTSYIKSGPIKFRVLDTTSNDENTPALFLLTEYPIGYRRFYYNKGSSSTESQDWSKSEMRGFLNGESEGCVYKDCFNNAERKVIMPTTKRSDKCKQWCGSGYYSCKSGDTKNEGADTSCKLNNDYIFLLSAEEVLDNKYGFSTAWNSSAYDINRKVDEAHTGGMWPGWWLRSACSGSSNDVAYVNSSGSCNNYDSYNTGYCVRCALNIPLSSVLMTSYASDEGASPQRLNLVEDRTRSRGMSPKLSDEFKLTIWDQRTTSPRSGFSGEVVSPTPTTSGDPIILSGGEILTIQYSGAATKKENGDGTLTDLAVTEYASADEYITVIIRRDAGENNSGYAAAGGNYYGIIKKIARASDAHGTLKLAIPEGIAKGNYTVMIMNEQRNGPYKTNYANKFDIPITILETQPDTTDPIIIGKVYKNAAETTFLVKAKDNGMLKEIRYTGVSSSYPAMQGQECKMNFMANSAITGDNEFQIYNQAGRYTSVKSSSCIVDSVAPTVIKEEEEFHWKLILQDSESGLWKITDASGNIIKDYSKDGYPITQEEFIVPWMYDSVKVYDAVGNVETIPTDSHQVGTLGYSYIKNPTWSGSNDTETSYNKVYFGGGSGKSSYFNDTSHAMVFRVLDNTANDDNCTPALFMLSEYATKNGQGWDGREAGSNIWYSSNAMKNYLNTMLNGCFSEIEKEAIMSTTKTEEGDTKWYFRGVNANPKFYYAGATNVQREKLFLLSAKEVIDIKYGFSNKPNSSYFNGTSGSGYVYGETDKSRVGWLDASDTTSSSPRGNTNGWWLRSASSSSSYYVACVSSSGGCNVNSSDHTGYCVRCALNIPLSSILMTSYATVGSSSSETTFSPLPTPTVTASPFKLTIEDKYTRKSNPNGKFKITENAAQVACGEILSLNYTNKHYDKIIGIIKNDSEAWRALGTINGSKVDFKMPGSGTIPPGIYKMVVYDECNAGAYKTNYAEYDTLTLRVVASGAPTDTIAPSILNAYKNQAGTMYKITVEDTGSGLAQLNSDKEVKYISPIGVSATPIANTTKNIETSAGNSITVYDLASNAKPVSESEIIVEDKTAPVYTITYHKGDYTIHVSDNESGVWKITDSTGTKVLKDWSR